MEETSTQLPLPVPGPSKAPLVIFVPLFIAWGFLSSTESNSYKVKLDELIVSYVMFMPFVYIVNCMIMGKCYFTLWLINLSIIAMIVYTIYTKKQSTEPTRTDTPPQILASPPASAPSAI